MADPHAAAHAESHLPAYNRTIVALAVMTGIEFGVAWFMKEHANLFTVGVLVLIALAGWKALLVGRIFMHLRFDPRLLGWIAVTPVLLAAPLVVFVVWDLVTVNSGTAAFGQP